MGLDISYYKLGKQVNVDEEKFEPYSQEFYDEYGEDIIKLYVTYFDEQSDGLEGYYESEYLGGFRAGSYSGHGQFRRIISQFSQYLIDEGKEDNDVFDLFLNFSDCEGFMGPFTCEILYNAFKNHEKDFYEALKFSYYGIKDVIAVENLDERDWYISKYKDWLTAFKQTAGEGVVLFH